MTRAVRRALRRLRGEPLRRHRGDQADGAVAPVDRRLPALGLHGVRPGAAPAVVGRRRGGRRRGGVGRRRGTARARGRGGRRRGRAPGGRAGARGRWWRSATGRRTSSAGRARWAAPGRWSARRSARSATPRPPSRPCTTARPGDSAATGAPPHHDRSATVCRMATVLVVEDDPGIRSYLIDALTAFGHVVRSAADGFGGLREVTQTQLRRRRPRPGAAGHRRTGRPADDPRDIPGAGPGGHRPGRRGGDHPAAQRRRRRLPRQAFLRRPVGRPAGRGAAPDRGRPPGGRRRYRPGPGRAGRPAAGRRPADRRPGPDRAAGRPRTRPDPARVRPAGVPRRTPGRRWSPSRSCSPRSGASPTWTTRPSHVHLSALRRKLGEPAAAPRYLHTVRGVGFKMVAPR